MWSAKSGTKKTTAAQKVCQEEIQHLTQQKKSSRHIIFQHQTWVKIPAALEENMKKRHTFIDFRSSRVLMAFLLTPHFPCFFFPSIYYIHNISQFFPPSFPPSYTHFFVMLHKHGRIQKKNIFTSFYCYGEAICFQIEQKLSFEEEIFEKNLLKILWLRFATTNFILSSTSKWKGLKTFFKVFFAASL